MRLNPKSCENRAPSICLPRIVVVVAIAVCFFFTSSVSFCRNCNYNTLQIHLVRLDARSVRRRIFSSVFGFDLMNPFCLCMRLLTFAIYRSNGAFYVYTIN